jgi:tripartite-type tricarboxylate transporter receptor subunit TctC
MRRFDLKLIGFAFAAAMVAAAAHAQTGYPSKPMTLIVAFAAGGDSDLSGRNLAQHAQKYLNNQPIVVMNRVGASGQIGSMATRTAPADGYTLLAARIASHAILPAMEAKTPYKWNDFTFISLLELNPYVCVVPRDAPWKTMGELIDAMRKEPGKLNFSTSGIGTVQNLGVQYLFSVVGLPKDAAVGIHYKGGGEVTTSLLGGQVQFACNNLTTIYPHIKAGVFRALMTTTPERLKDLPEVPTVRELGWPEMEKITGWTALIGPPGLTKEVTERWAEAMQKLARDPDWLAGNVKLTGIPAIRSAAETEQFMREQYELYEKIAIALGVRQ